MWSDQAPEKSASSTYAHSKGFSAFDNNQGFIISHSAPRYPEYDLEKNEIYLDLAYNAIKSGQHFLCISLDSNNLEKYAQGLRVDRPFTYVSYIPDVI